MFRGASEKRSGGARWVPEDTLRGKPEAAVVFEKLPLQTQSMRLTSIRPFSLLAWVKLCVGVLLSGGLSLVGGAAVQAGPYMDHYNRMSQAQYDYDKVVLNSKTPLSAAEKQALKRQYLDPVRKEGLELDGKFAAQVEKGIRTAIYSELKSRYPMMKFDSILDPTKVKGNRPTSGGLISSKGATTGSSGGGDREKASPQAGSGRPGQVLDLSKMKSVEYFGSPPPPPAKSPAKDPANSADSEP